MIFNTLIKKTEHSASKNIFEVLFAFFLNVFGVLMTNFMQLTKKSNFQSSSLDASIVLGNFLVNVVEEDLSKFKSYTHLTLLRINSTTDIFFEFSQIYKFCPWHYTICDVFLFMMRNKIKFEIMLIDVRTNLITTW